MDFLNFEHFKKLLKHCIAIFFIFMETLLKYEKLVDFVKRRKFFVVAKEETIRKRLFKYLFICNRKQKTIRKYVNA